MTSNTQNANTQNGNNKDRAYNVITQGFGFLNRVKEITPQSGNSYLACDVALLQGVGDNVTHARFQCTVRGKNAIDVIRKNFTNAQGVVESPEKTTVVASMKLGGITPELFTYNSGEKKGQQGVAVRSTLLDITWLKIGDNVIDLESDQQSGNGNAEQAAPATGNGEPAFVQEMRSEYGQNGSVKLSKDHPEFEARRAFLKNAGFTFDRQKMAWVMKEQAPAAPAPAEAPPKYEINF